MMPAVDAMVDPGNYVRALGLTEPPGLSPEARAALFALVLEECRRLGRVVHPGMEGGGGARLEMRVARSGWHVRLGGVEREEVDTFFKLGALVFAGSGGKPVSVVVAAIAALRDRIRSVSTEFGERSVIDGVIAGSPGTVVAVVERLTARPCPYSESGCRFLADGGCAIDETSASEIAQSLTGRMILRRLNAFEPAEYGVEF